MAPSFLTEPPPHYKFQGSLRRSLRTKPQAPCVVSLKWLHYRPYAGSGSVCRRRTDEWKPWTRQGHTCWEEQSFPRNRNCGDVCHRAVTMESRTVSHQAGLFRDRESELVCREHLSVDSCPSGDWAWRRKF